jgi:hypothetical protein
VSEQIATETTESQATRTVEPAIAFETNPATQPADPSVNAAILRCCEAAECARQDVLSGRNCSRTASMAAREAFAKAMPPLHGAANIRDFIACVAYGMLANHFPDSSGAKLLYAAQVAYNAHIRRRPHNRKPTA